MPCGAVRSSLRGLGLLAVTLTLGHATAAAGEGSLRGVFGAPWSSPSGPALLVLLLAAVAGVLAWRTRSGSGPTLDAEQFAMLADEAAQEGRLLDALAWVGRARARSPESPRLLIQEAHLLGEAGRLEDAMARFEAAARMVPDGEPNLLAARLLARHGRDPGCVAHHLADALARTPSFVLELPAEPLFRDVLAAPQVVEAQEEAWRMLHARSKN